MLYMLNFCSKKVSSFTDEFEGAIWDLKHDIRNTLFLLSIKIAAQMCLCNIKYFGPNISTK